MSPPARMTYPRSRGLAYPVGVHSAVQFCPSPPDVARPYDISPCPLAMRLSVFPPLLLWPLLVCLILFSGCDEEVLGPTRRGDIDGRVLTFDTRDPVAGASVTTSPATGAFVTDADGAFALSNVESGTYNIAVRKNGFQANTLAVSVRDDATTPATVLLERSDDATRTDSLTAEITNWSNRTVNSDTTFVDVEYRVRNAGTTDIAAYEVYLRVATGGDPFFQEIRGNSLPVTQADVGTVSKFIRDQTANAVTIDDVWFESATAN